LNREQKQQNNVSIIHANKMDDSELSRVQHMMLIWDILVII
jgi:hypothetical protein